MVSKIMKTAKQLLKFVGKPYICICTDKDGKAFMYNNTPTVYGDEWEKTKMLTWDVTQLIKPVKGDWDTTITYKKDSKPNQKRDLVTKLAFFLFGPKIPFN